MWFRLLSHAWWWGWENSSRACLQKPRGAIETQRLLFWPDVFLLGSYRIVYCGYCFLLLLLVAFSFLPLLLKNILVILSVISPFESGGQRSRSKLSRLDTRLSPTAPIQWPYGRRRVWIPPDSLTGFTGLSSRCVQASLQAPQRQCNSVVWLLPMYRYAIYFFVCVNIHAFHTF